VRDFAAELGDEEATAPPIPDLPPAMPSLPPAAAAIPAAASQPKPIPAARTTSANAGLTAEEVRRRLALGTTPPKSPAGGKDDDSSGGLSDSDESL
jgi:hypothetical protein